MNALLRWIGYSTIISLSFQLPLYAQEQPVVKYASGQTDSARLRNVSITANNFEKAGIPADNEANADAFDEDVYFEKVADLDADGKKHAIKPVVNLFKEGRYKSVTTEKKRSHKFYFHLANIFARLKMYPLAMKCYFKTLQSDGNNDIHITDTVTLSNYYNTPPQDTSIALLNTRTDTSVNRLLTINNRDEQILLTADTNNYAYTGHEIKSKPEEVCNITDPFDDGKKAMAYALLIHISQPVSGKRKIFVKLSKVGHTFITLIKYNADSTSVSRSFGFYPKKDHFLSATPLFPTTKSVFKDDELHGWDETVGKFISERKFRKILQVIKDYDQKKYNLNKNNCTDFGLNLAGTAGIKITDTSGSWPFGHGNNPASAGQSVLEGKVLNIDSNYNLFICNDLDLKP
ncbi:hypothetical protein SNE25_29155 [Mucilaginibacter sabulilitoris]|uniref:DUF4105 domain-containing protein n=1 Tax=Mucilaginibacter sabulilitoris TaxID=1173583 RepID=A0ABZ0TJR9_9SPHI|nr:hypothetical protein [Mucilaginibacter sabulilitoris]WPU93392.1 hypothetical protein SNE25_29155 [Mucilaginibacter sabulilitoris]